MAMRQFWFFPFALVLVFTMIALIIFVFAFWIWMIVDCAKRNFKNDLEKIIWIVIIAITSWVGALVYYIVIKRLNPKGLSKHAHNL